MLKKREEYVDMLTVFFRSML